MRGYTLVIKHLGGKGKKVGGGDGVGVQGYSVRFEVSLGYIRSI